jgi:hypothetical protein
VLRSFERELQSFERELRSFERVLQMSAERFVGSQCTVHSLG